MTSGIGSLVSSGADTPDWRNTAVVGGPWENDGSIALGAAAGAVGELGADAGRGRLAQRLADENGATVAYPTSSPTSPGGRRPARPAKTN